MRCDRSLRVRTFYSLVLRFRGLVLALLTGLSIWFGSYLWPLDTMLVDFSFEGLLVAEGAERDTLATLHEDFGEDTGVLSLVIALPPVPADVEDGSAQWLASSVFAPQVVGVVEQAHAWFAARPEFDASAVVGLPSVANLLTPSITPAYLRAAYQRLERVAATEAMTAQQAVEAVIATQASASIQAAVAQYTAAVRSLRNNVIYQRRLVSSDGSLTVVRAAFDLDASGPDMRDPAITATEALVAELTPQLPAGTALHLIGVPVIQKTYSDIALRDIGTFIPITCLLIMLLLWVAFRSPLAVIAPMTGVGMATIWGLGLMQMHGEPLNLVNNVTGVVALVIGVADGVHVLTRYYQLAPNFADKRTAIVETMVEMTPACLVTSITTAIGFGSLATAAIPSIRAFGIYVGITILFAFAAQMLVMPVFLSMVRKPDGHRFVAPATSKSGRTLIWVAAFVARRPKAILVVSLIVVGASVAGISQVENDAHALDELADDHPIPTAIRTVEEKLTGVLSHAILFTGHVDPDRTCQRDDDCAVDGEPNTRVCRKTDATTALVRQLRAPITDLTLRRSSAFWERLETSLRTPQASENAAAASEDDILIIDDGPITPPVDSDSDSDSDSAGTAGVCVESIKNPAFIRAVEDLDRWLTEHPAHQAVISEVASVTDLLHLARQAIDPAVGPEASLPVDIDRAWIHQTLGVLESGGDDTLSRQVTRDFTKTHVTIQANDAGTRAWQLLRDELEPELARRFGMGAEAADGVGGRFDVVVTGSSTMTQNALDRIMVDMTTSLAWAFLWIAVMMALLFRSIRVAVVAMVPNILPLVITLAMMGLAGVSVRVSTAIIFSVALGIAVDDTIHYLYRYRGELRRGATPAMAASETIIHTGRAIVLTTVILVVGFMVNLFSDFVAIQQFGLFSAATFVLAVVADLVVLPSMARLFLRSRDFL
ncbi:MAG: putative RND superfamily exporter protein [Myxococcota bacterium]|jgi:predicted RND superfamily exporter protein